MNIESLYQLFLKHRSVQTDTRKLQPGDIYFALKGENFNGNSFAKQALELGASYAIIDEEAYLLNERTVLVDDVLTALQALAKHHRQQFDIPFIAITGSNGKTTTKELIHAVLSSSFKTHATKGNLNNHIGVPLTLLGIEDTTEIAIIEMGANHQKEIASYCEYTLPTHALINNCGKAHLEGFGGIEGVRKGKGELYDFIRSNRGVIFRNADLDYLTSMADGIAQQITYGSPHSQANYKGMASNTDGLLNVSILNAGLECTIRTQLVGEYNFPNVMAAVAIGLCFNIPIDTIRQAIENYAPDNSRSQLVKLGTNIVIMDAYNANPTSMKAAIQNFVQSSYANKIIIIGGMKELGNDSIQEHQEIVTELEKTNWNKVVLVGGDFAHTQHHYVYFDNTELAAQWYSEQQFENTTILLKGSRAMTMEKVINVKS